jgi:Ran GTPase-activating protein (RanGAP) involved in mRNA processing and transport
MVLLNNPTITQLDLSRNKISFDGAELLMKSLWLNTSLTELNLQMNPIKDKGGVAVGSALRYNTTLTASQVAAVSAAMATL